MPRALSPSAHQQLYTVVDGAVRDTLLQHPEYLTKSGRRYLAHSVTKRLAGNLAGLAAEKSAARGRQTKPPVQPVLVVSGPAAGDLTPTGHPPTVLSLLGDFAAITAFMLVVGAIFLFLL